MWNVSNLRGSKTLSQFPAATSKPATPAEAIPLRNPVGGVPKLASSTMTLTGIVPSNIVSSNLVPGNITPDNVALLHQTRAASANGTPWATTVQSLCLDNPSDEWLGAACMVFALAEMLCELPEQERLAASITKTEINTHGELALAQTATGGPPAGGESTRTEATLVRELMNCLVAGTNGSVSRGTADELTPDERAPALDTNGHLPGRELPVWLQGLPAGAALPTRVAEFAMWLGLQLNLPRPQQTEEIRLWVRRRRRLAQSQEGVLMHQLGGALTCLSSSAVVNGAPPRSNGWVWLSVLTIVLGVALVSHLLLR